MYAIELYVPKTDNEGLEIADGYWADLEDQIRVAFGGYTRFDAVGHWQGISEEIYLYRVILTDEIVDELNYQAVIKDIAAYIKDHWRQEIVLWTVTKTAEINFS